MTSFPTTTTGEVWRGVGKTQSRAAVADIAEEL